MTNDTPPHEESAEPSSEARVQRAIAEVLAPLVEADGGKIAYLGRKGDVAEISLSGACRGCPGQPMTLRGVILPALQAVAPELRDVRVVALPCAAPPRS